MLAMVDNPLNSLIHIVEYSEGASASIGTVTRNPGRLRQVLPNLIAIGSAFKLTAAGEIRVGLQKPESNVAGSLLIRSVNPEVHAGAVKIDVVPVYTGTSTVRSRRAGGGHWRLSVVIRTYARPAIP